MVVCFFVFISRESAQLTMPCSKALDLNDINIILFLQLNTLRLLIEFICDCFPSVKCRY